MYELLDYISCMYVPHAGSITYNTSAGSTEFVVVESGFGINRQISLESVPLPPLDLVTLVISAIVVSCIAAL